jgi:hypothetical protein
VHQGAHSSHVRKLLDGNSGSISNPVASGASEDAGMWPLILIIFGPYIFLGNHSSHVLFFEWCCSVD